MLAWYSRRALPESVLDHQALKVSPGTGGAGGAPCAHPLCDEGVALDETCDPCVASICAADPYCCDNSWDSLCVGEVESICGQTCGGATSSSASGTGGAGP